MPWLDPGGTQGVLEIRNESGAEFRVLLGARHEGGELGTSLWQLLRRLDPSGRSRREKAQQRAKALFIVCRQFDHLST